jgi:5'-AMP-activated protein kinase regulatory beta subunit
MGNYTSANKEGERAPVVEEVAHVDADHQSRTNKRTIDSADVALVVPSVIVETPAVADGDLENADVVPTVFKWEHGGRNVYITGTFNNWDRRIPMHRSGNDFTYVHNLKRGKHAFKFIVDDEWRFAPDQPTVADVEGRVSNFIDISDFQPYIGDDHFFEKSKERKIPNEDFGQIIPDEDEFTKEPLGLPPHLRHIILNKFTGSADPLALPVPQHVSLNHLYCTAIKDGIMVLGATQRYKEKYQTTVFYSTMMS